MYKRRLARWKFVKNYNVKVARAMLRKLAQNEGTKLFLNNREVDVHDLMRYVKRKGSRLPHGPSCSLSRSPTPDGLHCVTPPSARLAVDDVHRCTPITLSPVTGFHRQTPAIPSTTHSDQSYVLANWEGFLLVLRGYTKGALDARLWLCADDQNYCKSSKKTDMETDARGWISGQVEDACDLLDTGLFQEAGLRLIYVCDSAKDHVRYEAFNLIPELIILVLEQLKGHPRIVRQVLQHFRDMASVYHGFGHPLWRVLDFMTRSLVIDQHASFQVLNSAMSVIVDSVASCLGPLHTQSVTLRIDSLECGKDPLSSLKVLLKASDAENGITSITSMECLRAIAFNMFAEQEDIGGALSLSAEVSQRARLALDSEVNELGFLIALSIQVDAFLRYGQTDQAESSIQKLLSTSNEIGSFDSLHKLALLSRLQECLQSLGRQSEAFWIRSHRTVLLPTPDSMVIPD